MRVISGSARGRNLAVLPGDSTRPTTSVVKEAAMNILQFELEGAAVLELFAGTGQVGIEALSRGARLAVFVDQNRKCETVIRQNLETTKLAPKAKLFTADAVGWLSRQTPGRVYDIAFLDPPYEKGLLEKALPLTAALLHPAGAILCESARNEELPESAGEFRVFREYRYGKRKLTLYRVPEREESDIIGGIHSDGKGDLSGQL